jgi:large subunit ribosomal protein L4
MQLEVFDRQGATEKSIDVSEKNFDAKFNNALIHQVTIAFQAAGRAGTHAQKNRSAVRGGGAKPFRQKGSGRARAGTRSSPLLRGGGQVFAAAPRDYTQKVNRKSYRVAMRSILSEIRRRGNLVVTNHLELDSPKTKEMMNCLVNLNCKSVLIVDENVTDNLYLATRNIPNVHVIDPAMLNPADVVACRKLLMTESAVKAVDEWLQ